MPNNTTADVLKIQNPIPSMCDDGGSPIALWQVVLQGSGGTADIVVHLTDGSGGQRWADLPISVPNSATTLSSLIAGQAADIDVSIKGAEVVVTSGTLLVGRGGSLDGSIVAGSTCYLSFAVNSILRFGRCRAIPAN